MELENLLTELVKENGIAKNIIRMKEELENQDYLVKRYNGRFDYICRNEYLSENFIKKYHKQMSWVWYISLNGYNRDNIDLIIKYCDFDSLNEGLAKKRLLKYIANYKKKYNK